WVLERGVGGRLDATNVVAPELCVIPPIDYDHEQYLGRSLEAIAGEKAGILKRGVPAVFAPQRPEAARVVRARAAELDVHVIQPATPESVALDARGSRFRLDGLNIACPLAGGHQQQKTAAAGTPAEQAGVVPPATE